MAAVAMLDYVCRRIAEKNLTFTVGKEMYKNYRRRGSQVHEIAVSLVSEKDIEDTIETASSELHKPLRLLNVGRLDPEKGLHFLIEAVEELVKEKRLDIVLQMVGKSLKGDEEEKLRQEVERRRLSKHIHFIGYVSHGPGLLEHYRESDIFILPSLTGEGIPQTLFEAMACGIPVIATKVAGMPYLIEDEINGLLINAYSSREISEAVERIVKDSALRKQLIKNGLSTVRSHTMEDERTKVMKCIQDLLKHSQPSH
jgi:glycosyltransferase involved in cell wall biosynthesis